VNATNHNSYLNVFVFNTSEKITKKKLKFRLFTWGFSFFKLKTPKIRAFWYFKVFKT